MIRLIDGDIVTNISEQKADTILNKWTLENHLSEISERHDELFNKILEDYNYSSFAELSLWAQEPTNEYYEEANAIKEWYRTSWLAIKEYGETVTEATQKNIEQIITPFNF